MSISVKELNKLDKETYELIDIRSDAEIAHGVMPGAIQVSVDEIENNDKIDYSKKLVIVCARGKNSIDIADDLKAKGLDAVSLEGGYIGWLLEDMKNREADDFAKNVEQSIRKKFKKKIWSKFTKAINEYELVKERRLYCSMHFRWKRLNAYGKTFSGIKASQQV